MLNPELNILWIKKSENLDPAGQRRALLRLSWPRFLFPYSQSKLFYLFLFFFFPQFLWWDEISIISHIFILSTHYRIEYVRHFLSLFLFSHYFFLMSMFLHFFAIFFLEYYVIKNIDRYMYRSQSLSKLRNLRSLLKSHSK